MSYPALPEPDRTIRIRINEQPLNRFERWYWAVDEGFSIAGSGYARTRARAEAKAEKYARKVAARRVALDGAERISYEWGTR